MQLHTHVKELFVYSIVLFKIVSVCGNAFMPPLNPFVKFTLEKLFQALCGPALAIN